MMSMESQSGVMAFWSTRGAVYASGNNIGMECCSAD